MKNFRIGTFAVLAACATATSLLCAKSDTNSGGEKARAASTTRRKVRKPAADGADEQAEPETQLIDGMSGQAIRVLSPDAIVQIEKTTGEIVQIAKDRVPYHFRRSGHNIKFLDRGVDAPPPDSESYVTIEEVEELEEELDKDTREEVKASLSEDERRPTNPAADNVRITDIEPPKRD